MNVYFKTLIFSTTLLATVSAQAIPNIWNSEFGQGVSESSIKNEQGDVFTIT